LDRYETTATIAIVGNKTEADGFATKSQFSLPSIESNRPKISKKFGFSYSVIAKTNVVAF
jgi:hypothetical protein